jgi:hypothetical protein
MDYKVDYMNGSPRDHTLIYRLAVILYNLCVPGAEDLEDEAFWLTFKDDYDL